MARYRFPIDQFRLSVHIFQRCRSQTQCEARALRVVWNCDTGQKVPLLRSNRSAWVLSCLGDIVPHLIADTSFQFSLSGLTEKLFTGDCHSAFRHNAGMSSVDRLLEAAKQLPVDQRLTFISRLLRSNEASVSEKVKKEWDIVEKSLRTAGGVDRTVTLK
jgi:hypothetical protein